MTAIATMICAATIAASPSFATNMSARVHTRPRSPIQTALPASSSVQGLENVVIAPLASAVADEVPMVSSSEEFNADVNVDVQQICMASNIEAVVEKTECADSSEAFDIVVPDVMSADIAKMAEATVSDVLEAVVLKATEADVSAVAAVVYSKLVELSVKGVTPVELINVRREWYERFSAAPASRAWWILKIAKDKAKKGESVEDLKAAFEITMESWLKQDDSKAK